MAKHDESFKLEVVRRYLSETSGAQAIALRYGLDHSTVRRWVKGYQQHGVQGLRKKYGHYDAQFKLGVLRQMWAEELSCRQASTLFDVRGGHNVVSTWERQYHEGAYFSDRGRLFQADRGRRIGVAVAALGKRAGTGVTVS